MSTPVKSTINKMDPIRKGTSQVTVEQIQEDRLTVVSIENRLFILQEFNIQLIFLFPHWNFIVKYYS